MSDARKIAEVLHRADIGAIESIRERTDHPGSTCRLHDVVAGDRKLIAKVADQETLHERATRELHVLHAIGHRLAGLAPRLIAGESEDRPGRCIIIVEAVEGPTGDSLRGGDRQEIESVLDRMSMAWRIKADDPDLAPLDLPDWGRGTDGDRPHRRRAERFKRRGRVMGERFPDCETLHGPLRNEIGERFEVIAQAPGERPARLIHGDLHLDNVVFTPDGPRILDWQTASIGDPVDDVVRLAMESQPEQSIDSILELCDRHPETRTSPERLARNVILTYAGLVSGLTGRPDLEPGSREHRFARRMLSPGWTATPTRQALDILARTEPRDQSSTTDIP